MFLSGLTGAGESKETGGVSLPRLTGTAASGETDDGSLLIWLIINKQQTKRPARQMIALSALVIALINMINKQLSRARSSSGKAVKNLPPAPNFTVSQAVFHSFAACISTAD